MANSSTFVPHVLGIPMCVMCSSIVGLLTLVSTPPNSSLLRFSNLCSSSLMLEAQNKALKYKYLPHKAVSLSRCKHHYRAISSRATRKVSLPKLPNGPHLQSLYYACSQLFTRTPKKCDYSLLEKGREGKDIVT